MISKTKLSVSTFGTILGIAGIEHGIGEILQGNTIPSEPMFQSWPNNQYYEILAGEPAFTIVPNLSFFVIGILAIIFSTLLITWSIFFIDNKFGGPVLILLTLCQFLFGAGMAGPILIGVIIGLAATRIDSEFNWMNNHDSIRIKLAPVWKISYITSVVSWFSLWPGLVILSVFITLIDPSIVIIFTFISLVTLILTLLSAFACDSVDRT